MRARIIQAKAERLVALYALLDRTEREYVAEIESVASHIDRVRHIPNWPIDVELLTRLFGYVIIPPLAWVAAALVENAIDRL